MTQLSSMFVTKVFFWSVLVTSGVYLLGVGIRILGIEFTRTQFDTRRILDIQYPILWDWV